MSDSTTPATTEDPPAAPDDKEANALEAIQRIQAAFIEETGENIENLTRMRVEEDDVVRQLSNEILERMALLARRFDMPFGNFFPLNCVEYLLLSKWQGDAARLTAFVGTEENEGDAKSRLDALYAAGA